MKHRVSWLRVFVEVGVVVVSILLAFGIDAWWDHRLAVRDEAAALTAIRTEFLQNRERLAERIRTNRDAMERVGEFLRMPADSLERLPAPERRVTAVDMWAPYTFDPVFGASSSFLQRGAVVTSRGELVRRGVTDWERAFLDAGEESAVLWDLSRAALSAQTPYLAGLAPEPGDRPSLANLIARGDATPLTSMRDDAQLIGAVIAKINLQGIYTGELHDLFRLGDSILSLLDVDMAELETLEEVIATSGRPRAR